MKTIEELKNEYSKIKEDLENLKKSTLSDKEKQAEILQKEAEKIEKDIQKEIDKLKASTEKSDNDKATDAENFLKETKKDIQNLYDEIKAPASPTTPTPSPSTPTPTPTTPSTPATPTSSGNVFSKSWNWIKEQWGDIGKKEEWDKNPGTNTLRILGFAATGVGAVALAYKGLKKLFGWGKDKKDNKDEEGGEKEDTTEKKEKKPFWDRWYGKVLKYSIIGTPIYYLAHGIKTGKRGLKDLFNRGDKTPDATSTAENQAESTQELKEKDPEKFEKYKELGNNVDTQYKKIMEKEYATGREGMSISDGYKKYCDSSMSEDDFKATVPMCIDNEFKTVAKLLSESGYYSYVRQKNLKAFLNDAIGAGEGFVKGLLSTMFPFLRTLNSFKPYETNVKLGDPLSLINAVTDWLNHGTDKERHEELNLFFRQYVKILNYIQEKRMELIKKIAQPIWDANPDGFSNVQDAINDEEWFKKHIEPNPEYSDFQGGSIENAIKKMKEHGIFDANISEEVGEIINEKDEERKNILVEDDALTKIQNGDYAKGAEVADKLCKDIEKTFEESLGYHILSSAHKAINTQENNVQEFLKESGLNDIKLEMIGCVEEMRDKFKNKTITAQEISTYVQMVNTHFAMKKEIEIAAHALQTMKSDDPSFRDRVGNAARAFLTHDLLAPYDDIRHGKLSNLLISTVIPSLTIAGIAKIFGKHHIASIALGANPGGVIYKFGGNIMRRTSHIENMKASILAHTRYNIPSGHELLFQDVLEGKISGNKANDILNNYKKKKRGKHFKSLEDLARDQFGASAAYDNKVIKDLFTLKNGDEDILIMKNEKIREAILGKPSTSGKRKKGYNGYYKRIYNPTTIEENAKRLGFGELFGRESSRPGPSKLSKLTKEQKTLLFGIMNGGDFNDLEKELKPLIENIDTIDLNGKSMEEIANIIEGVAQNPKQLENIDDFKRSIGALPGPRHGAEPIFDNIKNQTDVLDDQIKRETDPRKKADLQNRKTKIENFRNELMNMTDDAEFKRTTGLIKVLNEGGSASDIEKALTRLKNLEELKALGLNTSGAGKSLDEIIETLDVKSLRRVLADNPSHKVKIQAIVDVFDEIHNARNTGKALHAVGELADIGKTLGKLISKLT